MKVDLRVDFVRRARVPRPALLLGVAAVVLLAWQGWAARSDFVALQEQRAGLASLSRPAARAGAAMSPRDVERHAQMDQLARQLATPWPELMHLFETQANAGVVLLSLRPDAAAQNLELSGRAASVEALGAYLEALEQEPLLRDVLLTRHETVADDPARALEFSLTAKWLAAPAPAPIAKAGGQ